MRESTRQLRERILQLLHEADRPLPTMVIVARIGDIEHREDPRPLPNPHEYQGMPWAPQWKVVEQPQVVDQWVYLRPAFYSDIYPNLRALARAGKCWQLSSGSHRESLWTVVPPA